MQNSIVTQPLTDADILIIVPPFAAVDRPSLGVHILQACAREQGFKVDIFYANLLYAQRIGVNLFHRFSYGPTTHLLGERLFANAAYGHGKPALSPELYDLLMEDGVPRQDIERITPLAFEAAAWVDSVACDLMQKRYKVVGATTTFEQTAASIAFLNAVKRHSPTTVTIIGGANCEGPMAQGIASLSPKIDYIFSGESESTFLDFLRALHENRLPTEKIYVGEPNRALESLPCPDYEQFYQQVDAFVDPAQMEGIDLWLPYESSRGCWWGQKHHCTFCGLNGSGMVFRQKSADRILADLGKLMQRHPTRIITMADNIMPNNYFKTLLPRLAEEKPGYKIFYEQKANLDLRKVMLMRAAGIASIQPGIEALSTPLLRLMDKGVSAAQNIALLRYCLINGIDVKWNLLCGFPGDQIEWYQHTAQIVRLIPHLQPPTDIFSLSIDRFSPYFERATDYGIRHIRPSPSYLDVLPDSADAMSVAYHFQGTFNSETYKHLDVINSIRAQIAAWQAHWSQPSAPPRILSVTKVKDDLYILKDTRGLPNTKSMQFINHEQALVALIGLPNSRREIPSWAWGVQTSVAIEIDTHLVPLAVAAPELLLEMESAVGTVSAAANLIMPA